MLPHLRVSALDTALLQFSRDAQHQSLGPCSRSLHQCCSVKQDENSLACRCIHTYKFGTSHSSAAIQQRCAAPKPGTLFTLIAPGLLSKARRQQPCLLVLPHLRVSALDTALLQFIFFLGGKDIHYTSAMIATSRVCDVHHKPERPKLTTHLEIFRHES